jgi:hypothetical protein
MESQNNPFPVPSQQENAQKLAEAANTNPAPASESEQTAQVITFPSQAEASSQLVQKIGSQPSPQGPENKQQAA